MKQKLLAIAQKSKIGKRLTNEQRYRAIIRAVKQRNNSSLLLAAIRNIGYAEVAASVLTLQRSMLVSFGSMNDANKHILNVATGAAVCLFVLGLGITLLVKKERMNENGKI